jgi:endonuclease/exonuclease/phosphatase family metal-dependent hydrolase
LLTVTPDYPTTAMPQGPLRLMSYNIHHGAGVDGNVDLDRIAEVVKTADIVLLTEVDNHWRRSGFTDQAQVLAEKLNLNYAVIADTLERRNPYEAGLFGVARYGLALLSRFPIRKAQSTPLPTYKSQEPRVAITVDVQLPNGTLLRIMGTHLGLDHQTRLSQIDTLLHLSAEWQGPSVLMGDLNANQFSPEYVRLVGGTTPPDASNPQSAINSEFATPHSWQDPGLALAPPTFPSHRPSSRIDFILVSNDLMARVTRYESPETLASDHLPVLLELSW